MTSSCGSAVGGRKLRSGRRHSPIRSVFLSVPHHDRVPGSHLPGALRVGEQNRLSRQADKRSHLDLQIDLLAEREMTAVLQWLQDIADHLRVETSVTPEQLRDLMSPVPEGLFNPLSQLWRRASPMRSTQPEGQRRATRANHR